MNSSYYFEQCMVYSIEWKECLNHDFIFQNNEICINVKKKKNPTPFQPLNKLIASNDC